MQRVFEFGDFRFDPAGPSLTHGSNLVELTPKALEILSVLVTNAGQVVRKDDLLSLVWPHTVVEEGNLAVHVSFLTPGAGEAWRWKLPDPDRPETGVSVRRAGPASAQDRGCCAERRKCIVSRRRTLSSAEHRIGLP